MAINAVHPFFEVDVIEVNRDAFSGRPGRRIIRRLSDRPLQLLRSDFVDYGAVNIQQIAFTVLFENSAVYPPVAIEIGELRVFELAVQLAEVFKKLLVAPQTSEG